MNLHSGSKFSHYRILSKLGEGGMGEVYLAEDQILERKVALKILDEQCCKESERLQRFVREAKASSALNHPNIITIFEFGSVGDSHFIASELIEGETLGSLLERGLPDRDAALRIAVQIASALQAAHSAGIVHRDIKPENVMVRPDGIVKVLDFGVAKLMENRPAGRADPEGATRIKIDTSPGMIIGTANYMSPEQAAGKPIDHRSDIFSFGVLLYEILSGKLPFQGVTPVEIIGAILYKEPAPLSEATPDAAPDLCAIVAKAMAKDPADRYQHIGELLEDLRKITGEGPGGIHGISATSGNKPEAETKIFKPGTTGDPEIPNTARQTAADTSSRPAGKKAILAVSGLVIALVAATAGIWYFGYSGNEHIDSIAVMPLVNEGGDPDTEYLSDGITETLIGSLAKVPDLNVKSQAAVFRYKGKNIEPKKVGSELNVQALLNGRMKQRGDQLALSFELIDAATENVIWSHSYTRNLNGILGLQDEVARDVTRQLQQKLTKTETGETNTEDAEAYILYLKGRYYTAKFTKEGLDTGLSFFNQAIDKDPEYANGYAGIAYSYITAAGWFLPSKESLPKAKEAAKKALAIDPDLAAAHQSLAIVHWWYDWDPVAAETEYRRSIELDPKNVQALASYGFFLSSLGRSEEGLAEGRKAVALDPLSPETNALLGQSLYFSRKYKQAEEQLRQTIELDPSYWFPHSVLARTLAQEGRKEEALKEAKAAAKIEPEITEVQTVLAYMHALNGNTAEAESILARLRQKKFVPQFNLAEAYVGLRKKEEALSALEQAYDNRSFFIAFLRPEPLLDPLRNEPRFKALLKRTGLGG